MTEENMVIGHIDALKSEFLSRFTHILKSIADLEIRIIELEQFQTDIIIAESIRYREWCKTNGVDA